MSPTRIVNIAMVAVAVAALWAAPRAHAGESHYHRYAVGERAGGMGGAFTALADESTGAFYNPAGIVDAPRRGRAAMGLTVSAYQLSFLRHESRVSLGDKAQDLSITDFSTFASAFGYVHTFGKGPKHAVGLTITVPENDSSAGSVNLSGVRLPASSATDGLEFRSADLTQSFRALSQAILFGLTYAVAPHPRISVGASLLYALRRERVLSSLFLTGDTNRGRVATTETLEAQSLHGALAGELGVKVRATEHLRFGVSVRSPQGRIHNGASVFRAGAEGSPAVFNSSELDVYAPEPLRLAVGVAWEVPKRYTLAFDLKWFASLEPYSPLIVTRPAGTTVFRATEVSRRNVVNVSLGGEWRASEQIALRGGFFTDFTGRPPAAPVLDGPEHINLYGLAFALAWLTNETTLTFGVNWAFGLGDVPGVRNRFTDQQEVFNASASRHFVTFFFGGSYSL